MTSEVTYKVWLQGSDGKNYLVSLETFKKDWLNINSMADSLVKLEERVERIEKPIRKFELRQLLKKGPRSWHFLSRRGFYWRDLRELIQEGKVVEEKHGHFPMYRLTEERRRPNERP